MGAVRVFMTRQPVDDEALVAAGDFHNVHNSS